ncbi:MAG: hypothetical protein KGS61_13200, partial [Verrucomicrobia bacterium]|nr:hypothetical protein [Verrucomicrobiota bacterium]
FLSACATQPVVLRTVGPGPTTASAGFGQGLLVVYSDTDEIHLDQSSVFYIHSSYFIQTPTGHQVKWVKNHVSNMDVTPERVALPAGTYLVVARSEDYGRVRVPVVIEAGRTTEVHLADTWKPRQQVTDAAQLVRFPNGYLIGWAAPATSATEGNRSH